MTDVLNSPVKLDFGSNHYWRQKRGHFHESPFDLPSSYSRMGLSTKPDLEMKQLTDPSFPRTHTPHHHHTTPFDPFTTGGTTIMMMQKAAQVDGTQQLPNILAHTSMSRWDDNYHLACEREGIGVDRHSTDTRKFHPFEYDNGRIHPFDSLNTLNHHLYPSKSSHHHSRHPFDHPTCQDLNHVAPTRPTRQRQDSIYRNSLHSRNNRHNPPYNLTPHTHTPRTNAHSAMYNSLLQPNPAPAPLEPSTSTLDATTRRTSALNYGIDEKAPVNHSHYHQLQQQTTNNTNPLHPHLQPHDKISQPTFAGMGASMLGRSNNGMAMTVAELLHQHSSNTPSQIEHLRQKAAALGAASLNHAAAAQPQTLEQAQMFSSAPIEYDGQESFAQHQLHSFGNGMYRNDQWLNASQPPQQPQQQALLPAYARQSVQTSLQQQEWQEHLLSIAHAKYSCGEYTSALSLLQTLFCVAPSHIPTLLLLGCACYSLNLYALSLYYNHLILSIDATFAEAYSNMGTTYRAMGNDTQAEECYVQAVKLTPDYWDGIRNLVGIYCAKGKYAQALKVYQDTLTYLATHKKSSYQPTRMRDLHYGMGSLKFALGDAEGAKEEYHKAMLAVGLDCHAVVMEVYKLSARYVEECKTKPVTNGQQHPSLYQGALVSYPQHVLHLMEQVVMSLRIQGQACARDESWVTSEPATVSTVLQTLAKLYQDSHALSHAIPLYYLSLSIHPNPHTCNLLGILLTTAGFQNEAIQFYHAGLNMDRNHVHLYTNLGSVLKDQGHILESIRMYEKAVQLDPKFEIALANLANVMKDVGRVDEACALYKRALAVNPSFEDAFCNYVNVLCFVCDWRERESNFASLNGILEKQLSAGPSSCASWSKSLPLVRPGEVSSRKARQVQLARGCAPPGVPTVLPFHTFTYPLTPRQIRLISYRNAARILYNVLTSNWYPSNGYQIPTRLPSIPATTPDRRIRLGYVSSDFGNHPLSHLMQSVFGMHDTSQFEVYCYALSPSDGSAYRNKIEHETEHFRDVHSWSVEAIARQINQVDQIHVLVNLNGYTKGARNEIFAARVAPIQVALMGFAGTMGAVGWIDYLVADEIAVPSRMVSKGPIDAAQVEAAHDDWIYTEKMIYLPDTYFVNDHRQGFRNEGITSTAQVKVPDQHGKKDGHERGKKSRVYVIAKSEPNPDARLGNPIERTGLVRACENQLSQDIETEWLMEEVRRWKMRKEVFDGLSEDTVIFANFNQLYKVDPVIFQTWLKILQRVPNSILWLLKFPAAGEAHLKRLAKETMGPDVANRVIFTDIAPKHIHIARGRVVDCFLDTPECNGHTTACDILWSGSPIVTLPRHVYKMCSRVAATCCYATGYGDQMVACDEQEYEEKAVAFGRSLRLKRVMAPASVVHKVDPNFPGLPPSQWVGSANDHSPQGFTTNGQFEPGVEMFLAEGPLYELKKNLYLSRDTNRLFDTKRWVRNLEKGLKEAWRCWTRGEVGHDNIYVENEEEIRQGRSSISRMGSKRLADGQRTMTAGHYGFFSQSSSSHMQNGIMSISDAASMFPGAAAASPTSRRLNDGFTYRHRSSSFADSPRSTPTRGPGDTTPLPSPSPAPQLSGYSHSQTPTPVSRDEMYSQSNSIDRDSIKEERDMDRRMSAMSGMSGFTGRRLSSMGLKSPAHTAYRGRKVDSPDEGPRSRRSHYSSTSMNISQNHQEGNYSHHPYTSPNYLQASTNNAMIGSGLGGLGGMPAPLNVQSLLNTVGRKDVEL